MIHSFSDLIDRFGGPASFARDVGMTPGAAKQARRRNSLSGKRFKAVAAAAERRGLEEVTLDLLAKLATEVAE